MEIALATHSYHLQSRQVSKAFKKKKYLNTETYSFQVGGEGCQEVILNCSCPRKPRSRQTKLTWCGFFSLQQRKISSTGWDQQGSSSVFLRGCFPHIGPQLELQQVCALSEVMENLHRDGKIKQCSDGMGHDSIRAQEPPPWHQQWQDWCDTAAPSCWEGTACSPCHI